MMNGSDFYSSAMAREFSEKSYPCPALMKEGNKKSAGITKGKCQEICGDPLGNKQCLDLSCRSKWLYCPHCVKRLPIEALRKLEGKCTVDGHHGCCLLHKMNGPDFDILSVPSVRIALIGEFPVLFANLPEPGKVEKPQITKALIEQEDAGVEAYNRQAVIKAAAEKAKTAQARTEVSANNLNAAGDVVSAIEAGQPGELIEAESQTRLEEAVAQSDEAIEALPAEPVDVIVPVVTDCNNEQCEDVEFILPSSVGPRKFFSAKELERLTDKLKAEGQWQTVQVIESAGCYEIVKGEDVWQAAKCLGWKKLKVKRLNLKFQSEADQYLEIAVANRESFAAIEMARILKKLILLFPEQNRYRIADSFTGTCFDAREWMDSHLRLLKLDAKLICLMEANLPGGPRLDLETVLKLKLFEMAPTEQRAAAKDLAKKNSIKLPRKKKEGKKALQKEQGRNERRTSKGARLVGKAGVQDRLAAHMRAHPELAAEIRQFMPAASLAAKPAPLQLSKEELARELADWYAKPGYKGKMPDRLAEFKKQYPHEAEALKEEAKRPSRLSVEKNGSEEVYAGACEGFAGGDAEQADWKFELGSGSWEGFASIVSEETEWQLGAGHASEGFAMECVQPATCDQPVTSVIVREVQVAPEIDPVLEAELRAYYAEPGKKGGLNAELRAYRQKRIAQGLRLHRVTDGKNGRRLMFLDKFDDLVEEQVKQLFAGSSMSGFLTKPMFDYLKRHFDPIFAIKKREVEILPTEIGISETAEIVSSGFTPFSDVRLARMFAHLQAEGKTVREIAENFRYETCKPISRRLRLLDDKSLDPRVLELASQELPSCHRLSLNDFDRLMEMKLHKQLAAGLAIQLRLKKIFPT
jgi:ParB family chromosome partitioning protein